MSALWKHNKCGFFLTLFPLVFICTVLPGLAIHPLLFLALAAFLAYPFVLTVINLYYLCCDPGSPKQKQMQLVSALITLMLGFILNGIYSTLSSITGKDWWEQLPNTEIHTPIATAHAPSFLIFALTGLIGFLLLHLWKDAISRPPLATVLCISMMYIGCLDCILYMIQVWDNHSLLMLFPANCLIITAATVRQALLEWRTGQQHNQITLKTSYTGLNRFVQNAGCWPITAFVLMFPVLGILICLLLLFGQAPDSFIKAFTQTSDWKLSQQISPPNVQYDEHYLCTVAAGGHGKLVKPLRLGKRHDHVVTVNRQLCIANAFEQILEERTPTFHKAVRTFYDTCGYPIARHIHSPYTADVIYLLMKPAEWLFLLILYLCDTKPENRIAMQYLPHSE